MLIEDFLDILRDKPGRTPLITHCIALKPGCPIQKGLSRIPEQLQEPVRKEIQRGALERSLGDFFCTALRMVNT